MTLVIQTTSRIYEKNQKGIQMNRWIKNNIHNIVLACVISIPVSIGTIKSQSQPEPMAKVIEAELERVPEVCVEGYDSEISFEGVFLDRLAAIEETTEETAEEPILASLGEFTITYFCACEKCCGKPEGHPAYGITASGTTVCQGRTIAVDPTVIPLGETVLIDGHEYIAEDTGSSIKGNHIDIYISDHETCLQMGVDVKEVYIRPSLLDID